MEMRKILAHGIRMQKNPQTKEDTFWIFTDFHGVMRVQSLNCRPKIPIKMLKQHTIPNSSLHNLKIYSSKGCRKTIQR